MVFTSLKVAIVKQKKKNKVPCCAFVDKLLGASEQISKRIMGIRDREFRWLARDSSCFKKSFVE